MLRMRSWRSISLSKILNFVTHPAANSIRRGSRKRTLSYVMLRLKAIKSEFRETDSMNKGGLNKEFKRRSFWDINSRSSTKHNTLFDLWGLIMSFSEWDFHNSWQSKRLHPMNFRENTISLSESNSLRSKLFLDLFARSNCRLSNSTRHTKFRPKWSPDRIEQNTWDSPVYFSLVHQNYIKKLYGKQVEALIEESVITNFTVYLYCTREKTPVSVSDKSLVNHRTHHPSVKTMDHSKWRKYAPRHVTADAFWKNFDGALKRMPPIV